MLCFSNNAIWYHKRATTLRLSGSQIWQSTSQWHTLDMCSFPPFSFRSLIPTSFFNLWTSARQFYTWQFLSSFRYDLSVSYINVSVWTVPWWSYFNLLGSYIYSDWCFNSEVLFDYFFIFVFTLIFYSFRFAVCNLIFLGEPSVLCNMCKLLLNMVLFSQIYIVIWAIRNLCRLRFSSRVIWSRLLVFFSTNSQQ